MTEEEIYPKIQERCPTGFTLKEAFSFSYPYRDVTIRAKVCKKPDASMANVYKQILLTIDAGLSSKKEIFHFLGISRSDEFMVHEMKFLREKNFIIQEVDKYSLTSEGHQFIADSHSLTIEEIEDYRFLLDGITLDVKSAKPLFTHHEKLEKFIKSQNPYSKGDVMMLEPRMEKVGQCYKENMAQSSYLMEDTLLEIKKDRESWVNYLLAVYLSSDETDLRLEVLMLDSLARIDDLTSLFNQDISLYFELQ